jgi:hypothetical protein
MRLDQTQEGAAVSIGMLRGTRLSSIEAELAT